MVERAICVDKIRQDFPIYLGEPMVYLDSAATTQKPICVLDAINDYYTNYNANVHRGFYWLSEQATAAYESARGAISKFIGASVAQQLIFTRGTTESINLVAFSWAAINLERGDAVLLTEMEHHSNLIPWQLVAQRHELELRFIPVLDDGSLDMEKFSELLDSRVKLVALAHMSNVTGTINPIAEIVDQAHSIGARVLVDAAQSVPHMPVNVSELKCDFLAFSGHKMLGPTGIGGLYVCPEAISEMEPFMGGGEMINSVTLESATWAEPPAKFESGTPNIAGVIGLGAAVGYLQQLDMESVRTHARELTEYGLAMLGDISGVRIVGNAEDRGGVLSFDVEGIHPHDVAQFASEDRIAIRAGHHCAQPLIQRFGYPALCRASLYVYNNQDDLDQLAESICKSKRFFNNDS